MEYVTYTLVAGAVAFGTFAVMALVGILAEAVGRIFDSRRPR